MQTILRLRELQPIAIGKQRYVYAHPLDLGLIVKVPTERYVRSRAGLHGRWYKKWHKKRQRSRHNLVFLREIREHLALSALGAEMPHHVQTIVGFAQTDLGMGLVSRAIRDRNGALAPTLLTLLKAGRLSDEVGQRLDEFFAWLLDSPVIVGDLNVGNLVYGYEEQGGSYFVLIDGLGDKNLIPVNSMSRRINRWSKRRRIRRLKQQIASYVPPPP